MKRLALIAIAGLALAACKPQAVAVTPAVAAATPQAQGLPVAATLAASPDWLEGQSAATAPAQPDPGPSALPGQSAEVVQERAVQQDLPKSADPLWAVLRTTKILEDRRTGLFTARHSPQVQALAGQTLTLSGFMVPIEQEEMTRHFLVSRYTPVCLFCPPGDPNEVVEVRTRKPLKASYDMVKVTGTFSLANNGEKGLFFRLEGRP